LGLTCPGSLDIAIKREVQMKTIFAALCLLLCASASFAQTRLDPTFGTGGKVTTGFDNVDAQGNSVAVQRDGKVVVAGTASDLWGGSDFALARYNSNGSLDENFGTGGKIITDFGNYDWVSAVALQSDGKIIEAGATINNYSPIFAVVRYNSNGTLDGNFGSGGKVTSDFGGPAQPFAAATQQDGKVLVAGFAHLAGGWAFAVVRYNNDGTPDATFGTNGKQTIFFGPASSAQVNAIAIQQDGKIVLVGSSNIQMADADFSLVRLNSDGTLDNTFGNGGQVVTNLGVNDHAFAAALQADGKIVAEGMLGNDFALVRYNTDGTLDATFGAGGKVITDFAGAKDMGLGVGVRTDGKIVAVGQTQVSGRSAFAVARYNSNGTLDTTFGSGGEATLRFDNSYGDFAYAVAIQPDGKAVVAGFTVNSVLFQYQFALARFQ